MTLVKKKRVERLEEMCYGECMGNIHENMTCISKASQGSNDCLLIENFYGTLTN